jgi:metacaspase-1
MNMAKGISLHVGINKVSSAFPGAGLLHGCENDAIAMQAIAVAKHYIPSQLLGPDATYERVVAKIRDAACELQSGDIFLFTFAGHGFTRADGGDETDDHQDETIVFFDLELLDDVLRLDLWPSFKAGVRVLMISDSCHSGSVSSFKLKNSVSAGARKIAQATEIPVKTSAGLRARTITEVTMKLHRAEYRRFYERILVPAIAPTIQASVLLLAACPDGEDTPDGCPHGAFTQALLDVMNSPHPPQNYDDLLNKVGQLLAPQTPVISVIPTDNPAFRALAPFSI